MPGSESPFRSVRALGLMWSCRNSSSSWAVAGIDRGWDADSSGRAAYGVQLYGAEWRLCAGGGHGESACGRIFSTSFGVPEKGGYGTTAAPLDQDLDLVHRIIAGARRTPPRDRENPDGWTSRSATR